MDAPRLNYHHLQYFWAVARDGNLTRAAAHLRVSQSALSSQIRQLEASLGVELFVREGRTLALSEAGEIALAYADTIFTAGADLVTTLTLGRQLHQVLAIGAVATLSRNFQESFVKPLLGEGDVAVRLVSGSFDELLGALGRRALDLVLSNQTCPSDPERQWRCQRIARQGVSIVGAARAERFRFPRDLASARMILPAAGSEMRAAFDAVCERAGVAPRVLAEVDDMAALRLLARDANALALVPSVVVRDELLSGQLHEHCVVPGLFEHFYAITATRRFPHPRLKALLSRNEADFLAMPEAAAPKTRRTLPRKTSRR